MNDLLKFYCYSAHPQTRMRWCDRDQQFYCPWCCCFGHYCSRRITAMLPKLEKALCAVIDGGVSSQASAEGMARIVYNTVEMIEKNGYRWEEAILALDRCIKKLAVLQFRPNEYEARALFSWHSELTGEFIEGQIAWQQK